MGCFRLILWSSARQPQSGFCHRVNPKVAPATCLLPSTSGRGAGGEGSNYIFDIESLLILPMSLLVKLIEKGDNFYVRNRKEKPIESQREAKP